MNFQKNQFFKLIHPRSSILSSILIKNNSFITLKSKMNHSLLIKNFSVKTFSDEEAGLKKIKNFKTNNCYSQAAFVRRKSQKDLLTYNPVSFIKYQKHYFCTNKPKDDQVIGNKTNEPDNQLPQKKIGFYKKFKLTMKQYGKKALILYGVLYVLGFALAYSLVEFKILTSKNIFIYFNY